jgi:hypothetical protein
MLPRFVFSYRSQSPSVKPRALPTSSEHAPHLRSHLRESLPLNKASEDAEPPGEITDVHDTKLVRELMGQRCNE